MSKADCFAQLRPAVSFGQWGGLPGPPTAGSATGVADGSRQVVAVMTSRSFLL